MVPPIDRSVLQSIYKVRDEAQHSVPRGRTAVTPYDVPETEDAVLQRLDMLYAAAERIGKAMPDINAREGHHRRTVLDTNLSSGATPAIVRALLVRGA